MPLYFTRGSLSDDLNDFFKPVLYRWLHERMAKRGFKVHPDITFWPGRLITREGKLSVVDDANDADFIMDVSGHTLVQVDTAELCNAVPDAEMIRLRNILWKATVKDNTKKGGKT